MSRVVVITGASRGLGLSLAKKFVERGDRVFGISKTRKNWPKAKKLIQDEKLFSLETLDVTSEKSVSNYLARTIKKSGKLDILINNAGYGGKLSKVEETPILEFEKHFTSNLLSQFLMSKHTIKYFRKQSQGLIINISSMAGKRAVPQLAGYSASKFGVLALSQAIAKENRDTNLKCITVCPGGMNTEMRSDLFGKQDAEKQQSTDFVADIIMDVIDNKLQVESGGDILIRHGQFSINPDPAA